MPGDHLTNKGAGGTKGHRPSTWREGMRGEGQAAARTLAAKLGLVEAIYALACQKHRPDAPRASAPAQTSNSEHRQVPSLAGNREGTRLIAEGAAARGAQTHRSRLRGRRCRRRRPSNASASNRVTFNLRRERSLCLACSSGRGLIGLPGAVGHAVGGRAGAGLDGTPADRQAGRQAATAAVRLACPAHRWRRPQRQTGRPLCL